MFELYENNNSQKQEQKQKNSSCLDSNSSCIGPDDEYFYNY